MLESVRRAWNQPFKGDSDNLLATLLRSAWTRLSSAREHSEPYATQFLEVQSTGCGKSRRVHELSFTIFAVPFNVNAKNTSESEAGNIFP